MSVFERIELPEVAPASTQNRRLAAHCRTCGMQVVARVPEAARVTPFGPRLNAVATRLQAFQAQSYEPLQAALSNLFGLTLSQRGLLVMLRRTQACFRSGREAPLDAAPSHRRRLGGTGVRMDGRYAYRWVFHSAEAVDRRNH